MRIIISSELVVIPPSAICRDADGFRCVSRDFILAAAEALKTKIPVVGSVVNETISTQKTPALSLPQNNQEPFTLSNGKDISFCDTDGEILTFSVYPLVWKVFKFLTESESEDGEHIDALNQEFWDGVGEGNIEKVLYERGNSKFKKVGFPWRFSKNRASGCIRVVPAEISNQEN